MIQEQRKLHLERLKQKIERLKKTFSKGPVVKQESNPDTHEYQEDPYRSAYFLREYQLMKHNLFWK